MGIYNPPTPIPNFFNDDYIQSDIATRFTKITNQIPVSNLLNYNSNYGSITNTGESIAVDVNKKSHFFGFYMQSVAGNTITVAALRAKLYVRVGDGTLDQIASLAITATNLASNSDCLLFAPIFDDSDDFIALAGPGVHFFHGFRVTLQKVTAGGQTGLRGGWAGTVFNTKDT